MFAVTSTLFSFAGLTFKALYNAFLKKSVDDVLWPMLKGVFSKHNGATLQDCFRKAFAKILKAHPELNDNTTRERLRKELFDHNNDLSGFPNFKHTITGELYEEYLNEISKNKRLVFQIRLHVLRVADKALTKINNEFSQLVSEITQINNDLHQVYLSNGLGVDLKIVNGNSPTERLNKHVIARDCFAELTQTVSACKILNLYGGRYTGKDVLAKQIANSDQSKDTITLDLHYGEDTNAIEIIRKQDSKNRIIVINNLDYHLGNSYSERIISFILEGNLLSTYIITTHEPISDMLGGHSTRGVLCFEVKDFNKKEMEQLVVTYGMPQDSPIKGLIQSSYTHPIVANACCALCEKDKWQVSKVLKELLFQIQDFDLPRKLAKLMENVVPDADTRHLMARISILRFRILPTGIVQAMASIPPSINGFQEKVNGLMPEWFTKENGNIHVNNLLNYWQYGLQPNERKQCFIVAAECLLNQKVLTPTDVAEVIMLFANGEDYDRAGMAYMQGLEKLKTIEILTPPVFAYFWIGLPLPKAMHENMKVSIRICQLVSPIIEEKYKTYIVADLLQLLKSPTMPINLKGLSYRLISFYAASKGNNDLVRKCLELDSTLTLDFANLPDQLKEEQKDLDQHFKQIPTYLLLTSRNVEDFRNNLNFGKIDISLSLAFSLAGHIIAKMCPDGNVTIDDWKRILTEFERYLDALKTSDDHNLRIAFTTQRLLIKGKDMHDLQGLISDYAEVVKNENNPQALGMYQFAVGYAYYVSGRDQEASTYLSEAEKVMDELPDMVSRKILLLLSFLAAKKKDYGQELDYVNRINDINEQYENDIIQADVLGEIAIAYWMAGRKDEAVRMISRSAIISLEGYNKDKSNIGYKYLISKLACCASQWQTVMTKGHYASEIVEPYPGMFSEDYRLDWLEGDFGLKTSLMLFQMYQIDALTINENTGYWAKQMMESAKENPSGLHRIFKLMTIPMIQNGQFSDLTELLKLDIIAKSLPMEADAPKTDPTGSFFLFFILPLFMRYAIEIQSNQVSGLLQEVIMPLINQAQDVNGYCDKTILDRIMQIIEGQVIAEDESNEWVRETDYALKITGNCHSRDAFLYTYQLLHLTDHLNGSVAGADKLMFDFAMSVLQRQMVLYPEELDIKGIHDRGYKYIEETTEKYPYKRVMNVLYTSLKQEPNISASFKNSIMDWLGI